MINFLLSIPLPLWIPFYSFLGIFTYLTIKTVKNAFYYIGMAPTDVPRPQYSDKLTLKEELLMDLKRESVCIITKVFLMIMLVLVDFSWNICLYVISFIVTGIIFLYLPSLIVPSKYVINVFTINVLFLINAMCLFGLKEGSTSDFSLKEENTSGLGIKEGNISDL